jgi:hypothetical protein
MTIEQSPVTILGDLIEQLESKIDQYEISTSEALARAYAAGADQQLAEDAKWLDYYALNEAHLTIIPVGNLLKEAMRFKPPSLKKQALAALDKAVIRGDCITVSNALPAIRRALESLPD